MVFGTGNFGKIVVRAARDCGIVIEKICDSNSSNWGTTFCGYPVVGPDELNANDIVLLATNISNRKFLRKLCENKKLSLFIMCKIFYVDQVGHYFLEN